MTPARAVGMCSLSILLAASNGGKTVNTGKRDEEINDERTKRASRVPCSGNAESRERQTRRYLVGLHAARRVRRGVGHLRADLANSHFHNPDAHGRSVLPRGQSARIGRGATDV